MAPHIGQKLTLGMVGRFGRVFRLFQLGFGAFTLGDITIIPDAASVVRLWLMAEHYGIILLK